MHTVKELKREFEAAMATGRAKPQR
jgi:hypothetical protein